MSYFYNISAATLAVTVSIQYAAAQTEIAVPRNAHIQCSQGHPSNGGPPASLLTVDLFIGEKRVATVVGDGLSPMGSHLSILLDEKRIAYFRDDFVSPTSVSLLAGIPTPELSVLSGSASYIQGLAAETGRKECGKRKSPLRYEALTIPPDALEQLTERMLKIYLQLAPRAP